jgi:mRNA interferase MazF
LVPRRPASASRNPPAGPARLHIGRRLALGGLRARRTLGRLDGAVVVSNDAANATANRLGRGVITVVPVTSNVVQIYPFQVLLRADQTGLGRDSKAQAEQIRSVAVERIGNRVGRLPPATMTELDEAIRVHLAL